MITGLIDGLELTGQKMDAFSLNEKCPLSINVLLNGNLLESVLIISYKIRCGTRESLGSEKNALFDCSSFMWVMLGNLSYSLVALQ